MSNTANTTLVAADFASALMVQSCDFQRPLNRQYVKTLADTMERGEFHGGLGVIVMGKWPGRQSSVVLDGQHRLAAVVASGRPQWLTMSWVTFPSEAAAKKAYARIDRGRRRTVVDVARALHGGDVAATDYANIMAASKTLLAGDGRRADDDTVTALSDRLIPAYKALSAALPYSLLTNPGAEKCAGCVGLMVVSRLATRYPLAVALASVCADGEPAATWWGDVATMSPRLPSAPLARTLLLMAPKDSTGRRRDGRRLARAYVAYRDGEDLVQAKWPKEPVAIGEFAV